MNGLTRCVFAVMSLGTAAHAADQGCDQYSFYRRLPSTFHEIASGELSGTPHFELFVVSNGSCVCTNVYPKRVNHPDQKVWSCRPDTDAGQPDANTTP